MKRLLARGGCQDDGRFPSRSQKLDGHVDAAHIDEASHPELKLLEALHEASRRPLRQWPGNHSGREVGDSRVGRSVAT